MTTYTADDLEQRALELFAELDLHCNNAPGSLDDKTARAIIATALAAERERAIEEMRHEVVSLCEAAEASYATVTDETEGKFGAYARGRLKEAKSIRNAMCEVARALSQPGGSRDD